MQEFEEGRPDPESSIWLNVGREPSIILEVPVSLKVYSLVEPDIYTYIYMSVRQYSLSNPVPWTNGGGPIAFAGFGAAENQGIAFGGFCHNIVTL